MITSVPQSDIPAILIHQLECFFPINEEDKECIIERLGGYFSDVRSVLVQIPISIIIVTVKHILIPFIQVNILYSFISFQERSSCLLIPSLRIKYIT